MESVLNIMNSNIRSGFKATSIIAFQKSPPHLNGFRLDIARNSERNPRSLLQVNLQSQISDRRHLRNHSAF